MYQLVLSRSFLIDNGENQRRILVPFGDMVNHSPTNSNAEIGIDIKKGIFKIESTGEIQEGEEVF